jgi:hypothetical protein
MKFWNWMLADASTVDELRHLVADLTAANKHLASEVRRLKGVIESVALDAAELADQLERERS